MPELKRLKWNGSMSKDFDVEFKKDLMRKADIVTTALGTIMQEQSEIQPLLSEAMKYTLLSGGKRIRGAIVLWICQMLKGKITHEAKTAAAAIEMVHTYSLVHDDLPAMDNDDLRRGKPTLHKKYDEATAILAGDGLLTLAFEMLATEIPDSNLAIKLVGVLATVAGPSGMVAGQMADILAEKQLANIESLEYIHQNKTAMMFSGAATLGALCGDAKRKQLHNLANYGLKLGLCFQIADDILDVCSTSEEMGKTVGKDQAQDKTTYPSLLGLEKSKEIAEKLTNEALDTLSSFDEKADTLRYLATEMLNRKN